MAYYQTSRWKALRAMVLARQPLCVACLTRGHEERAIEVDHIIPMKQGGSNELENLQGLCKFHHARKTRGFTIGIVEQSSNEVVSILPASHETLRALSRSAQLDNAGEQSPNRS